MPSKVAVALSKLREQGLTFSDCIDAFGEPMMDDLIVTLLALEQIGEQGDTASARIARAALAKVNKVRP